MFAPLLVACALAVNATPTSSEASQPLKVMAKARGFTLESAGVTGAAVLRANDHVDVVAVVTDPDSKQLVSVMLMQNVIVLANASPAVGVPAQVTLLVIPEEAQLLSLVKVAGQLTFILRNEVDVDILDEQKAVALRNVLPRPTLKTRAP